MTRLKGAIHIGRKINFTNCAGRRIVALPQEDTP
jgi:hypothetical protein